MAGLAVRRRGGVVSFGVKVVPGSSRTAVCGLYDGMVKVKVAAAPEKGKANECLVEFLAAQLRVAKKDVRIAAGATRPVKQVEVRGLAEGDLLARLGLAEAGNETAE